MTKRYAIVREPPSTYDGCLSDHPLKKYISIGKAKQQHKVYCQTLVDLGLEVIYLPVDDRHPDSCFVEDTAVVVGDRAFIGRFADPSRRGEEVAVQETLSSAFKIRVATEPAILEGGDVVNFGDKLLCGITKRTNEEGARQLREFMHIPVETFHIPEIMHLKSYVNYLGHNTIIVSEYYANHPYFENYRKIIVPKTETYATNVLMVNNFLLIPHNYPKTLKLIQEAGFRGQVIDNSEFAKCDGALTCLSIIV
ncbi:MAG: amidinotransferase [Asgard group archaeon]|nr:amidinotransferase [Asgard group archaeon]